MTEERPLLYFVTPAWRRYALTEACLRQRRLCVSFLEERGIEARIVVVADDENLDIARGLGAETVERDNVWLGRRFNDGIEHAYRAGADWIVPIGSDSFLDPAYLYPLPSSARVLRSSPLYAVAERSRLLRCRVARVGAGPYVIGRDRIPETGRPARDRRARGIDRSTLAGLRAHRLELSELHPWQYVGWRGEPRMNDYDVLRARIGVGEETSVREVLVEHYPPALVDAALEAIPA